MDETNVQTDSEIIAEFEELFGGSTEEESKEDQTEETEDTSEEEPEETEEEQEETEEDDESEESEDSSNKADAQVKKQREAFYNLRKQNKAQEKLIRGLGKILGFDAKADQTEIIDKVQELITQKEAKEQNVPVEFLQRMQALEQRLQENESKEREGKVQAELTDLITEFELDDDQVDAFIKQLVEDGKNPLEVDGIDLKAEYLKAHYEEMLEKASQAAVEKEQIRKEKVETQSAGTLPGKTGGGKGSEGKIETVSDLDRYFDGIKD